MMRGDRRGALGAVACLLALAAPLAGCRRPAEPPRRRPAIRLGVGTRNGDFDVMGRALAQTMRSGEPAYDVEIVANAGAVSILDALEEGKSDCGFSYANVAYEGYVGRLPDEPGPLSHLRGVALVEITPLCFVVRRGAQIAGVRDLPHRSLAVGPRGSGSYRAALLVLDAFGVDPRALDLQVEPFRASIDRMRAGALDGYFILAGQPADLIPNLLRDDAEILPLEGTTMDALRERYPFLHPAVIPSGTYRRQRAAVRTVGVESLLLCREDVEASKVRRVTTDWFLTLTSLAKEGRVTDAVSASLASATPIPLHPGASEFYRSRQVQFR
jgi:TRAP transporter TAXI family solute receptor